MACSCCCWDAFAALKLLAQRSISFAIWRREFTRKKTRATHSSVTQALPGQPQGKGQLMSYRLWNENEYSSHKQGTMHAWSFPIKNDAFMPVHFKHGRIINTNFDWSQIYSRHFIRGYIICCKLNGQWQVVISSSGLCTLVGGATSSPGPHAMWPLKETNTSSSSTAPSWRSLYSRLSQ